MDNSPPEVMRYRSLNADKIVASAATLRKRIEERFPGRGIAKVCTDLNRVAQEARQRAHWIARPHWSMRIMIVFVIGLLLLLLMSVLVGLDFEIRNLDVVQFLEALEAGINDLILLGAALFFIFTLESRIKRSRALNALRELRSLAHVIDMHQLTKDPERALKRGTTASSPVESMSLFELSRYLDYCSEMLSLIGKIAALYVQEFDDPVALAAVNEIENLTTGLSRKIWQKIMIIHALEQEAGKLAKKEKQVGDF